jgi:hypothetical protein
METGMTVARLLVRRGSTIDTTERGTAVLEAQKIAVRNRANLVMSFNAVCSEGASNESDKYPLNQTRVIDLGETPFSTGVEVWPEVHPIFGPPALGSAPEHVIFARNGQTATYEVGSHELGYWIKLVD